VPQRWPISTDNPQVVTDRDLSPLLRGQSAPATSPALPASVVADCSLETLEKFAIRQALRIAGNNKPRAALPPEVPMTTQERAYTSPLWYTPAK